MKKFLYMAFLVPLFMGCAENYSVEGSSSQYKLDGQMAYIKQMENENSIFTSIDSCEVLHGKFFMSGPVDSVMCVRLYMGNSFVPFVLETGNININITSDQSIHIQGTPLNDKLYKFLTARDSLIWLLDDIENQSNLMFLQGYSRGEILQELEPRREKLSKSLMKLEKKFVTDNFDNPLGLNWFLQICSDTQDYFGGIPTITPHIEEIYRKSPKKIKNDPRIASYMHLAGWR